MMLGALAGHAVGECVGYAAGAGRSITGMVRYEIDRDRYVAGSSIPPAGADGADRFDEPVRVR